MPVFGATILPFSKFTKLLEIVWLLLCILFLLHLHPRILLLLSFLLLACLLATWTRRSEVERGLMAVRMDGWMAGWISG